MSRLCIPGWNWDWVPVYGEARGRIKTCAPAGMILPVTLEASGVERLKCYALESCGTDSKLAPSAQNAERM